MHIAELKENHEFLAIWPLIHQLNPLLTEALFTKRLAEMRASGYRCVAAWHEGALVGVCGFWIGTRLWCGRYVDLDNVVVDETKRGLRIGKALVAFVEAEAVRLGCDIAVLDSYVTYEDAHRFYAREGYQPLGYHFVKPLKEDAVITGLAKPAAAE